MTMTLKELTDVVITKEDIIVMCLQNGEITLSQALHLYGIPQKDFVKEFNKEVKT